MITSMNDLPSVTTDNTVPTQQPVAQVISPSLSPEQEGMTIGSPEIALKDVGIEMELPKEVEAVGIKVQPTTVTIPTNVQKMGVQPAGNQVPLPTTTIVLPLTNDQITVGLHQSITSSFRWLAEWCVRKLKQLHTSITKSQLPIANKDKK